jgi:hypothetical protein
MTEYAQALSACRASEFADLFVHETGYFAGGFGGHIVGRERLITLVESERQCVAPTAKSVAPRPGGASEQMRASGPTVVINVTSSGVHAIASLGAAEYQDEYVKTLEGWRFGSRTVILAAENAAARDMLAIQL